MRTRWFASLSLAFLLFLGACAGVSGAPPEPVQPAQPVDEMLGMLTAHLNQLESKLTRLDKQVAELKALPDHEDPVFRELRALEIAGWELHLQQWRIQRDHLRYAESQLQRVKVHPEQKEQVHEEWVKQEKDFEAALESFRHRRHDLEHQRLQAEARLIERHFR